MNWVQRFEYCTDHIGIKSTEDIMASVLCATGCFAMIRSSALLKPGILEKFRSEPTTAVKAVQGEQGM